jgi:hypothetical protein
MAPTKVPLTNVKLNLAQVCVAALLLGVAGSSGADCPAKTCGTLFGNWKGSSFHNSGALVVETVGRVGGVAVAIAEGREEEGWAGGAELFC